MKTKKTKHYIEFTSTDSQGNYLFRVQKDFSQIQLETGNDSAFIDTNINELKAIRNVLNEVIGGISESSKVPTKELSDEEIDKIFYRNTYNYSHIHGVPIRVMEVQDFRQLVKSGKIPITLELPETKNVVSEEEIRERINYLLDMYADDYSDENFVQELTFFVKNKVLQTEDSHPTKEEYKTK